MADKARGSKKKNRKHGRNSLSSLQYKNSHRREHNKVRRLKKRLITHPNDKVAEQAIERCMMTIRGY